MKHKHNMVLECGESYLASNLELSDRSYFKLKPFKNHKASWFHLSPALLKNKGKIMEQFKFSNEREHSSARHN